MLSVFLVYPVINTILISFKDAHGKKFAGLDNYRFVFTDPSMLNSIRNTIGWICSCRSSRSPSGWSSRRWPIGSAGARPSRSR